ncbi:MAG: argininosuccinate lyase [Thermodesulfobacteriota bacterium]
MPGSKQKKPWSGAFKEGIHPLAERFTSSIDFDKRLYRYDIKGSIAHARMLAKCGIISRQEAAALVAGLKDIEADIEAGRFQFDPALEDIHMNIEHRLTEKLGDVGAKLHAGRSRNDQIALDLRLYLRDEIKEVRKRIKTLKRVLARLARKHLGAIMPGYTHLRGAQPVLFSHYLLAYYEMLERDDGRYQDCGQRVDVLPLGAAALAGSTLPLDRGYLAKLLGFRAVTGNSIDTVSDRDFVIEFVADCCLTMMHLSRLCEDLIIFSSPEFGFLRLPEAFLTGSSIMPQKQNPDVLELVRGKTGRSYGALFSLLTMMKGLPLSYNRDMQEDKEPLFDCVDTVKSCLEVLAEILKRIKLEEARMAEAAAQGFLTATDAAEYLVRKGVPFRQAHQIVGRLVRYCMEKKKRLDQLSLEELKHFSPHFDADLIHLLTPSGSAEARSTEGGTAKRRVLEKLDKIGK